MTPEAIRTLGMNPAQVLDEAGPPPSFNALGILEKMIAEALSKLAGEPIPEWPRTLVETVQTWLKRSDSVSPPLSRSRVTSPPRHGGGAPFPPLRGVLPPHGGGGRWRSLDRFEREDFVDAQVQGVRDLL